MDNVISTICLLLSKLTYLQYSWLIVGVVFGFVLIRPFKRCLATHNGILSMLIGSLMGIFSVSWAWVTIIVALCFFSYGLYQNHHKFLGDMHHDQSK